METVEYESNALREKLMHSNEKKNHDHGKKSNSNSPQKKSRIVKAFGKSSQYFFCFYMINAINRMMVDNSVNDKKNFAAEENKIKYREFLNTLKQSKKKRKL